MSRNKPKPEASAPPAAAPKCPECGAFTPKGSAYCAGDHCAKHDPTEAPGIEIPDDESGVDPIAMVIEDGKVAPLFDPGIKWIELRIPVVEYPPAAYLTKHVEIQCSPLEARGLGLLVGGVLKLNPKLANGRALSNNPDAIRYILQEIAKAAGEPKGGGS